MTFSHQISSGVSLNVLKMESSISVTKGYGVGNNIVNSSGSVISRCGNEVIHGALGAKISFNNLFREFFHKNSMSLLIRKGLIEFS